MQVRTLKLEAATSEWQLDYAKLYFGVTSPSLRVVYTTCTQLYTSTLKIQLRLDVCNHFVQSMPMPYTSTIAAQLLANLTQPMGAVAKIVSIACIQ